METVCGIDAECLIEAGNRAVTVGLLGGVAFVREQKEHCLCLPVLRLIARLVFAGLFFLLAGTALAQPTVDTWVFARDGVKLELKGGCADAGLGGLWLFVRVHRTDRSADTLELWFLDTSADARSEALHVVGEEPVPRGFEVGCIVGNGARLAWRFADGHGLFVNRLSQDGLGMIVAETRDSLGFATKTAGFAAGFLTLVADHGISIIDVEDGTVSNHERWTAAAWIEPSSGDLYSARSMAAFALEDGLPPVALAREAVLPDGSLRLLASTDSWPAMQPVEDGDIGELGPVDHRIGAIHDEILLLRSHVSGTGLLQIEAWDKTLRDPRSFAIDMLETPGRSNFRDSISVDGYVVVAAPKHTDERIPVRLLYIDPDGAVSASFAPPSHPVLQNVRLFRIGNSIYAVATQWMLDKSAPLREITVDVFSDTPPP